MKFSEPLTKDQLGQLRKADYIGFSRSPQAAYIVAEKGDNRHRVQVADRVHVLGGSDIGDVAYCSHTLHTQCTGYGRMWRSVAAFLKPGDQLALDWFRDAEATGYLADTNLHGDRLSLVIERGVNRFEFIVAVAINPNNTSRMILVGKNGS